MKAHIKNPERENRAICGQDNKRAGKYAAVLDKVDFLDLKNKSSQCKYCMRLVERG